MKFAIIIVVVLLLIFGIMCNKLVENFRGGRGGRGGRRGRGGHRGHGGHIGHRGHRGRGFRREFNPRTYVRGLRRNGGWGRRDYWRPYWDNVVAWPSWFGSCCKQGCSPNGCVNPGNGPNDCVWASDCYCC